MTTPSPFYEYRNFLKKQYGTVLYRVPLDPGFSCPNRGNDGSGGCIFCPEDGARAVQIGNTKDIKEQVRKGVAFAKKRYNGSAFMAYLQAFTSTFTDPGRLDQIVRTITGEQTFRAIAFGARPDCLNEATISYLQQLNNQIDVWVELGVQTSHDATLTAIHRGHTWDASREALLKLDKAGLFTAVHLIIGLPGEGLTEYKQTLEKLAALPFHAIKFHNLHVIKGTKLAKDYQAAPFPVFNEYEYAEILLELLPLIRPECAIIRLTTDTPPELLLGPTWSMNKGQFRRFLEQQMAKRQIYQGMALEKHHPAQHQSEPDLPKPVPTEDGSITFWNKDFKEYYHTLGGAHSEALQKYCLPAELEERLQAGPVSILDVCFGLGYNSLSSCDISMRLGQQVDIIGLEIDRTVVKAAANQMHEADTFFDWNRCLEHIALDDTWQENNCSIRLLWGDARHTATTLKTKFDLIWLDAFSTQRNAELWTVDFFRRLASLLKPDGAILTYCAAIPVRSGLIEAGLYAGETEPFARERGGTIASLNKKRIPRPLPERDYHLMETARGTPYRDPSSTRTNKEILRAREKEIVTRKAQERV